MSLSIFLTLFLAELSARKFLKLPYNDDKSASECDRVLGWRNKSNVMKIINTDGYVHPVVINSVGMHDREHSLHKGNDVFRILILGDSFVEAEEVTERDSSHAVIETVLNYFPDFNFRYEVISAGVYSWGPAQELMYYRTVGKFYKPDLILLFWCYNDLNDVIPNHLTSCGGMECYAPYFTICNGQFDTEPWFSVPCISPTMAKCSNIKKTLTSIFNYLYHHSRLYQLLAPLLEKSFQPIKFAHPFSPWLENNHEEILEYAYQLNYSIITTLAKEANQNGTKIAVIVIPNKKIMNYELLSSREQQQMIKLFEIEYPGLSKKMNVRLCNQNITTLMEAQGIPVLDLQPAFLTHLKAGGNALYWGKNGHWNILGNKIAGKLIANWLVDNQLVYISH